MQHQDTQISFKCTSMGSRNSLAGAAQGPHGADLPLPRLPLQGRHLGGETDCTAQSMWHFSGVKTAALADLRSMHEFLPRLR